MKTALPKIIPVPHTEITRGDSIEIAWTIGDTDKIVSGRVTRITKSLGCIEYITERGYILLTVYTSGSTEPKNISGIRIYSRGNIEETALPGWDELLEEVREIENA